MLGRSRFNLSFSFFRYFSGVVGHLRDLKVSQYVDLVESSSLIHHRFYP